MIGAHVLNHGHLGVRSLDEPSCQVEQLSAGPPIKAGKTAVCANHHAAQRISLVPDASPAGIGGKGGGQNNWMRVQANNVSLFKASLALKNLHSRNSLTGCPCWRYAVPQS